MLLAHTNNIKYGMIDFNYIYLFTKRPMTSFVPL